MLQFLIILILWPPLGAEADRLDHWGLGAQGRLGWLNPVAQAHPLVHEHRHAVAKAAWRSGLEPQQVRYLDEEGKA